MSRDQGGNVKFSDEVHESLESRALGVHIAASGRRDDTPSEADIEELKELAFGKKDTPLPKRRSSPPPPLPPDVHTVKGGYDTLDSSILVEEDYKDSRPPTEPAVPRSLEDVGQLETVSPGTYPFPTYEGREVMDFSGRLRILSNVPVEVEDQRDLEELGEAETALPNTYAAPASGVVLRPEMGSGPESTAELELDDDAVEVIEAHKDPTMDISPDDMYSVDTPDDDVRDSVPEISDDAMYAKIRQKRGRRFRKLVAAGVFAVLAASSWAGFNGSDYIPPDSRSIGTTAALEASARPVIDLSIQQETAREDDSPVHAAAFIEISQRETYRRNPLDVSEMESLRQAVRHAWGSGRTLYLTAVSTAAGPRHLNDHLSDTRLDIVAQAAHILAQELPEDERPDIVVRSDSVRYGFSRDSGVGGVALTDAPLPQGPMLAGLADLSGYSALDEGLAAQLETSGTHGYEAFAANTREARTDRMMVASRGRTDRTPDYIDADELSDDELEGMSDDDIEEMLEEEIERQEMDASTGLSEEELAQLDREALEMLELGDRIFEPEGPTPEEARLAGLRADYEGLRDSVRSLPGEIAAAKYRRQGNCRHIAITMRDASEAAGVRWSSLRGRRQRRAIRASYDACLDRAEGQLMSTATGELGRWAGTESHIASQISEFLSVVAGDSVTRGHRVLAEQLIYLADEHHELGVTHFGADLEESAVLRQQLGRLAEWADGYDTTHPGSEVIVPDDDQLPGAEPDRPAFEIDSGYVSLAVRAEQLVEELDGAEGGSRGYLERRAQEVIDASRADAEVTGEDMSREASALERAMARETACSQKSLDDAYKSVLDLGKRLEQEYDAKTVQEEAIISDARLRLGARAYLNDPEAEDMVVRNLGISREQLYEAATDLMLGDATLLEEPGLELRPAEPEYRIAA